MAQKFLICAGLQSDVRLFIKKRTGYPVTWTICDKDAKLFSSEESAHDYAKHHSLECMLYGIVDSKEPYAHLQYLFITPKP